MESSEKQNVYVFYHIFCNDNTAAIVKDQCLRIIFSRLYERVDAVYCFLVGQESKIVEIEKLIGNFGKKFRIAARGVGDTSFERFTLLQIRKCISLAPKDKFLYIHSKGVSKTRGIGEEDIFWWRTWLEYNLFSRYEECLSKLDEYDVVGVNYSERVLGKHFSGNFWWTTGKYYLSLPNEISYNEPYSYNQPERYILSGKDVKYIDIDSNRLPQNLGLYGMILHPKSYVD